MSFERMKVKLGDIVDIFTGFPFKSAQYSENPADIKLIRGDNIAQGVLRWDGVKRWPVGETDKLDSFWLKENDVLLAMDRPWIPAGLKFARVYSSDLPCLLVQRVACLRAKNGQDQNFIYSLLSTPAFSEYIQNVTTGTAVPHISVKQIKEFELEKLTLAEEREIGLFHGVIDSRIKLLRETNATLEAIAQALFKSWFVDFDPVHANAGTQAPSLPAEIQALFPSRLVESPQGLIPEGWEVGCIGDVVSVKGGYAFKSADFQDTGLPVIKIKNIVGDGTVALADVQKVSETIAARAHRFALQSGDILMAMTGATIGKVGVFVSENDELAYLNQRVAKFENKSVDEKNTWLAFIAFSNSFMADQIVNAASGSAQPNISAAGIESARLVVPSNKQVLRSFNDLVEPLFIGWINNQKSVKTLASLRDTLLPRLISGQLRLPEAEAVLAEVM